MSTIDKELMNAYFQMKKMSLSELYNLKEIAVKQNKLNFLKIIELAIDNRNKEKFNLMVV